MATSFSIDLPKGRLGIQPSITMQYSTDGGHSWLGQGWNLSLPSVNIDTRWGAPRYDVQKETESYTLGGRSSFLIPIERSGKIETLIKYFILEESAKI